MSVYCFDDAGEPLSDEALIAEIVVWRKAIREVSTPGGVAVIAGEGRRLEFTRGDSQMIQAALRDLLACARSRGLPIGGTGGHAIAVEIG